MQPLGKPMESTLKALGGPKGSHFEPPHEWSGIVSPTNKTPPPSPKNGVHGELKCSLLVRDPTYKMHL